MLREINEKINRIKEDLASKYILEDKLKNYKKQLEDDKNDLRLLEKSLKKEHKDVEKLEKISFTNLFSTLMKYKDEKLEKEQHEYLMAKIRYDEHISKVNLIEENIRSIEERILQLSNCDRDYKILINKKIELIKSFGDGYNKSKLEELERNIDVSIRDVKEVKEASFEGRNLLSEIDKAESLLSSARNWGIYDIVGGDFLSSMIKHNKINEAENSFRNISSLITRFNRELGDVQCDNITFSTTTIVFDIFLDNIFTDFAVQSKINDSLDRILSLKRKIQIIVDQLQDREEKLNRLILNKKNEYDKLIENL
ncbi:MAG: hypothetical protein RSC24_12460 [Clostridium sp.]